MAACVLPVDVRRPRAGVDGVTSAHASARGSKSEWLITGTMMRNSAETGRRREILFDEDGDGDAHGARSLPHRNYDERSFRDRKSVVARSVNKRGTAPIRLLD